MGKWEHLLVRFQTATYFFSALAPKTRLQALSTLDGLDALSVHVLLAALGNPEAYVRKHAIRLSEKAASLTASGQNRGELLEKLFSLAADPEPRVALQLAFSLGEIVDKRSARCLVDISLRQANYPRHKGRKDRVKQNRAISELFKVPTDSKLEMFYGKK